MSGLTGLQTLNLIGSISEKLCTNSNLNTGFKQNWAVTVQGWGHCFGTTGAACVQIMTLHGGV